MATKKKKATATQRVTALEDKVLEAIRAKFGQASALKLAHDTAVSEVVEVIPTGIDVLDHHVLGCGGLPVKRITEVFSEEGLGKTGFLLHCLAQVQQICGLGILSISEEVNTERCKTYGVDLEKLILVQPECLEELHDMLRVTLAPIPAKFGPILWGHDSVPATITRRSIEEPEKEDQIGYRAKQWGRITNTMLDLMKKKRVAFMLINQVRAQIGGFGPGFTTPGGNAIKFHAGVRLMLMGGEKDKDDDGEIAGKAPIIRCLKNKVAMPFRDARVMLNFKNGWDNEWSTLRHAMEYKVLPPRSFGHKNYLKAMELLNWPLRAPTTAEEYEFEVIDELEEVPI